MYYEDRTLLLPCTDGAQITSMLTSWTQNKEVRYICTGR